MILSVHAWSYERPGNGIHIIDRTDSSFTDMAAAVGVGVASYEHVVSSQEEGDYLSLNVSATANSRIGIDYEYIPAGYAPYKWFPDVELSDRIERIGVGDDVVVPIEIPYGLFARFYGGWGSAEYTKIYASSNGFLSFDNNTQSSPLPPASVPYGANPNSFIAGIWADLNIDSLASLITGRHDEGIPGQFSFVVIWKNVLHKGSNQRLTFEIIIKSPSPVSEYYSQSMIWISYANVSNINTDWLWGIEDQQGNKGLGYRQSGCALGGFNQKTIQIRGTLNTYYLKKLTLTFWDANPNSKFNILEEPDERRGYNVEYQEGDPSEHDANYMFWDALESTATTLVFAFAPEYMGLVAAAGLMIDTVYIGDAWSQYFAYCQYSGRRIETYDKTDGLSQRANVSAVASYYGSYPVDASLSIFVHWMLTDSTPGLTHTLEVKAIADYDEYNTQTSATTQHSVDTVTWLQLGPDSNNDKTTAYRIEAGIFNNWLYIGKYDEYDYYNISVPVYKEIYVQAQASLMHPSDLGPDQMKLTLFDPRGVPKVSSGIGSFVSLSWIATTTGDWTIRVHDEDAYLDAGFYSLYATLYSGGGGCPILYVNSTSQREYEGLLNIHNPNGTDISLNHTILHYPDRVGFTYNMRLEEYPTTHSYIDQAKLYAILPDGFVLNLPLLWAEHSEYGNVAPRLWFDDEWKTETMGADRNNGTSQTIDLYFLALPPEIHAQAFLFHIVGNNPYEK